MGNELAFILLAFYMLVFAGAAWAAWRFVRAVILGALLFVGRTAARVLARELEVKDALIALIGADRNALIAKLADHDDSLIALIPERSWPAALRAAARARLELHAREVLLHFDDVVDKPLRCKPYRLTPIMFRAFLTAVAHPKIVRRPGAYGKSFAALRVRDLLDDSNHPTLEGWKVVGYLDYVPGRPGAIWAPTAGNSESVA